MHNISNTVTDTGRTKLLTSQQFFFGQSIVVEVVKKCVCLFFRRDTPHLLVFYITHNDAPQSIGLLWTSDQPVAETSTWQHTQQSQKTDIHATGGIRTHNLSRRSAVDLRLRPPGHWDPVFYLWSQFWPNQTHKFPNKTSKSLYKHFALPPKKTTETWSDKIERTKRTMRLRETPMKGCRDPPKKKVCLWRQLLKTEGDYKLSSES